MAKKPDKTGTQGKGEIVLYQSPDGKTSLEVHLDGDTLWLSQKQLSDLFQTERSVITKHLGNIFRSAELERDSVCAKFAHTAEDGKIYQTTSNEVIHQSLRLVGQVLDRYEVNSDQAKALLRVVTDYGYALDMLDDYDHHRIRLGRVRKGKVKGVSHSEAMQLITQLRKTFEASQLFGNEKDASLESSLQTVMQSFDARDLYPSLEEKAPICSIFW